MNVALILIFLIFTHFYDLINLDNSSFANYFPPEVLLLQAKIKLWQFEVSFTQNVLYNAYGVPERVYKDPLHSSLHSGRLSH